VSFGAQETDRTKAVGRSYTETDFELNNMKIVLTESLGIGRGGWVRRVIENVLVDFRHSYLGNAPRAMLSS